MKDRGNAALRKLDFLIGVPLVFLLGLFRLRKRKAPDNISRIAILSTAALGDTLLHSILLGLLKIKYQDADIILICGPSNKAMAEIIHPENKIIQIPVNHPLKSIKAIRKAGDFDIFIDTGPWPRINCVYSFFSRSFYSIGFKTKGQARYFVYDRSIEHRADRHEIENVSALLNPLGIQKKWIPDLTPLFPWLPDEKLLLFHMFPGGYLSHYKEWNPENWKKIINYYTERGFIILLSGAPVDRERALQMKADCKKTGNIEVLAGTVSLKDCCRQMSRCRAVVSVNTGIMHIAAAMKLPMVALHGPTSVKRWGPLSPNALSLSGTTKSSGILNLGFEYDRKDTHSMDSISPETCIEKLNILLEKEIS